MSREPGLCRFALHGGAGVMDPQHFPAELRRSAARALQEIALQAREHLLSGASALDVVEQAVVALEDCSLFNAGHGAVLTHSGSVELDASIMDGRDRSAGAVAAVKRARNPIRLARWIKENTEHVMMAGAAADALLTGAGLAAVDTSYFITPERRRQLDIALRSGKVSLDHDVDYGDGRGTVGAVARDAHGHLAAATSTGGMTNQQDGRIGDSPVIGAGTWADDRSCCVSATGHGEYFLRSAVAHDVHARVAYAGVDLDTAAAATLEEVAALGGEGGLIAIDHRGQISLSFNSPGMYRAWMDAEGRVGVGIYRQPE